MRSNHQCILTSLVFIRRVVIYPEAVVLQVISKETHIMAANSVSLPATRVLTEAFRHLRYLILDELAERCSEALSPDSISWLLTVPAVWNKSTRQLIKEIAIEVSTIHIYCRVYIANILYYLNHLQMLRYIWDTY